MKNIFIAIALLFALTVSGQTEVEVTYVEGLAFKNLTTTQLNNITTKEVGDTYFDVTKGNPVYWTGSDWRDLTGGGLSPGDQTKLNFITVTQNVDLDDIESKANSALQLYTETDPTVTPSSIKTDLETLTGNNRLSASAIRDISANEADPVFSASEAASITATNKANWNSAFGWGDWGVGVDQSFIEGLGFTVGGTAGADWDTNLTNIPADIADGDNNTQLTPTQVVAAVDSEYPNLDTDGSDDFNNPATQNLNLNGFNIDNPSFISMEGGMVLRQPLNNDFALSPDGVTANEISYSSGEWKYGTSKIATLSDIAAAGTGTDDQNASEVTVATTNFEVLTSTELQGLSDEIDQRLLEARATGVKEIGSIALNGATGVDIGAIEAVVYDPLAVSDPYKRISTTAKVNEQLANTAAPITYWYVDSVDNTIKQQTTEPTESEYREKVFFLLTSYTSSIGAITGFKTVGTTTNNTPERVSGLMRDLGVFRVSGLGISAEANDLDFIIAGGVLNDQGANVSVSLNDPDHSNLQAFNSSVNTYRLATSSGILATDVSTGLDVLNYQVSGVVTEIPGNILQNANWGVIYFTEFAGGNVRGVYDVEFYADADEARARITTKEPLEFSPPGFENGFPIGAIAFRKGATDLSDDTQAFYFKTSKFGSYSGGATNNGVDRDDQTALEVPFTPNGSIAATNVQDAIEEVRNEAGGGTPDDNSVNSAKIINGSIVSEDLDFEVAPSTGDLVSINAGGNFTVVDPSTLGITANQAQSIANTGLKFFRTVTDGESTALGHVRIVTDASADYGKAVINKHTLATEITVTLDADIPDGGVISYYNQNADGTINFLPDTGFTINGFSDRKAVNDTTAFSGFIRDGTNFISLGGNELVALLPSNLYTNLDVVNPENETNANTGWTDAGFASTLSIETSNVQNGSFAYRLTNNAAGVNLAYHYYEITVEDGATYDFSFWGYEPTTSKVEISLTEYGGSTIFNGVSAKDVWEEKTGSFTVTGSTTVRINMRVNTEAGEYGLFDNFTITKQ